MLSFFRGSIAGVLWGQIFFASSILNIFLKNEFSSKRIILGFFLFCFVFVFVFSERERYWGRHGELACISSLPSLPQWLVLGHPKAWSQSFQSRWHAVMHLVTACCFPRLISSELYWVWSSQDWNICSYGMFLLQTVAYLAVLKCWPLKIF